MTGRSRLLTQTGQRRCGILGALSGSHHSHGVVLRAIRCGNYRVRKEASTIIYHQSTVSSDMGRHKRSLVPKVQNVGDFVGIPRVGKPIDDALMELEVVEVSGLGGCARKFRFGGERSPKLKNQIKRRPGAKIGSVCLTSVAT